jgi:type IV pilus assembly protein PilC
MPTFAYTARTSSGELKSATLEAASRDDAVAQLRRQRLSIVKVDEKKAAAQAGRGGTITLRDIVIFTRQFSTMINAGLPLVQALDILSRQSENKTLQAVIRQVVFDVEIPLPMPCAGIPRRSPISTPTWWRPARPAVSSTPS